DRGEAFLDGQLLLDGRDVLTDPAASGAGQVAGVERFEHQDHGKPLGPRQLLLDDVGGDPGSHLEWESHGQRPPEFADVMSWLGPRGPSPEERVVPSWVVCANVAHDGRRW